METLSKELNVIQQTTIIRDETYPSIQSFLSNLHMSVDKIKSYIYVRNIPFNIVSPFNEYRKQYQLMIIRKRCNGILISIKQLINDILTEHIEVKFEIVFRLNNLYEEIFNFSSDFGFISTNMIHIGAPKMMNPTKIKMPNLFQSIAESYQEEVCTGLSRFFSIKENYINDSDQDSVDSSIDTYNTLTGTLLISTSVMITRISEHQENFMKHIFDEIMLNLKRKLQDLICTIDRISPIASSFKRWDIHESNSCNEFISNEKLKNKVYSGIEEYFWISISNMLSHELIWWASSIRSIRTHQNNSDAIIRLINDEQYIAESKSAYLKSAFDTFFDALNNYVTVATWDRFFRLAYTSCFKRHSAEIENGKFTGTNTGGKFVNNFNFLTSMSNKFRSNINDSRNLVKTNIPVEEQIIVMHRLDHSIHIFRLWIIQETRVIAKTWNLKIFFLITKFDVVHCVSFLTQLKIHLDQFDAHANITNVQLYANTKMRAKIHLEIIENMQLLEKSPHLCMDILSKICQNRSLRMLRECVSDCLYKIQNFSEAPIPNEYVSLYCDEILLPVLQVTDDPQTLDIMLRLMCESWLDHIYKQKITFSKDGALQLLIDFKYILTWIDNCPNITSNVRIQLTKNEVLKKCQGVGKLLMRQTGEAISMNEKLAGKDNLHTSDESADELMPLEMYVPNQQQWLGLRSDSILTVKNPCHFNCKQ